MHLLYRNIPRIDRYLEFHNHDKFGDESDIVSHEVSNMRWLTDLTIYRPRNRNARHEYLFHKNLSIFLFWCNVISFLYI